MKLDFLLNQLRRRNTNQQSSRKALNKRGARPGRRRSNFESLETRQLLAAVIIEGSSFAGDMIEVTADASTMTVSGAASGNGVYTLANITSLSIDGKSFNDKVTIKNSLALSSNVDISIIAEEIYVDPGVSISGGDITLRSIGDEHALSIASNIPFLDIADIFAGDRTINIGAGASLSGKDITIEAERISSLLRVKSPFGFGKKDVNIIIDQATITGDSVIISAQAKDENLLDELPTEAKNWVQNYGGSQLTEYIANGLLPTIPYAVMVRSGEANISVDSSVITSAGTVSITSNTATDSTTEAVAVRDSEDTAGKSAVGALMKKANNFSAGYSQATSTATTTLSGSTTINAAGDVLISSTADTIAEVTASTEINSADQDSAAKNGPANTNALGASLAIAKSSTTSTTLLGSGVEIVAPTGNVNIRAMGTVSNKATSGIEIFVDGRGGLGVALGFDEADINATVHGTIIAGGSSTSEQLVVPANTPSTDRITIPNHGFSTGDELLYLAEDPTNPGPKLDALGNLVDGESVRVIVINNNEIQLVRELGLPVDASHINNATLHTFRKAGSATFDASTSVVSNRLTVETLAIAEGAAITYAMGDTDPNKGGVAAIGGLVDQGTYVALNVTKNVGAGTSSFELALVDTPTVPILITASVGDAHAIDFVNPAQSFLPQSAVNP